MLTKVPSASCLLNLSDAALDWPGVLECGIMSDLCVLECGKKRKLKLDELCLRQKLQEVLVGGFGYA
jgi:hypothetical protein